MSLCTKSSGSSSTVDFESDKGQAYLKQLELTFKNFTSAITQTQNAFQQLLIALDNAGQVYGNLANASEDKDKQNILDFQHAMREMKESGPFMTFNSELHDGTINVFDNVKIELRDVMKNYKDLKVKKNNYDKYRVKVEKTETAYAKKDKPLVEAKDYNKNVAARDEAKDAYEEGRTAFNSDVTTLKRHSSKALHTSMNNFVHTTAALSGYLEKTLEGYRTDNLEDGNNSTKKRSAMDKLVQQAERKSVSRRYNNQKGDISGSYPPSNPFDNQKAPAPPQTDGIPLRANDEEAPHM